LSVHGISDVATDDENSGDDEEDDNNDPVPAAQWPISIRDEDGNLEEVIHPGHKAKGHPDGVYCSNVAFRYFLPISHVLTLCFMRFNCNIVLMMVPRFWIDNPVSVHQMTLMPRELAMKIGSCIHPNKNGNYARGDECPLNERTIYVAIASYRDWQCRDTVTSIFSRAQHPERVRVGVVDQIVEGEDGPCDAPHQPCKDDPEQPICKYKSQLDVFQVEASLSIGPVFARHIGHRLYRGEYYYMQSDAQ